jgi:hypothetical protein
MVSAIIFGLHGVALLGVIVWRLRTVGIVDAALAAGLIIVIFSVGWTLSGLATTLLVAPEGIAEWMDRDTIALVFVTLGEIVFYTVFLKVLRKGPKAGTGQQ